MQRTVVWTILMNCAGVAVFSQSTEPPPKFEIADVHVSAKVVNPFIRTQPVRGGRYELKNATMVDLIRIAYGFAANKILGGPHWLEMDRFDVIAKVPADTTPETQKLMLQALLEDRFKLAARKETKPLPTYALTVGKKPQLKEADGKEDTGCHPQTVSAGADLQGGSTIIMGTPDGGVARIALGPGNTVHYACRNITMAAFAAELRGMVGASLGPNEILDETGLKGSWNFDVKWSMGFIGPLAAHKSEQITTSEAIEKQLGLKLETRQVPTPVIVVESVNEKPSANPPGVAEALPPTPLPTEFEVASVKPSAPAGRGGRLGSYRMHPGGEFNAEGMTLRFLITRAFNTNIRDQLAGIPSWADTEPFDIVAKAPSAGPSAAAMDDDALAPMLRALLADRFKMTYHTEDRPASAYSLFAVKPKLKKADPDSRTFCKMGAAPPGAPPGSQLLTCQNVSMEQFTDRLQNMAPELSWPVLDATGIEGGWDLALTFSRNAAFRAAGRGGRGGDAGSGDGALPSASEPTGVLTVFEAVEKQLGLKLEMHKRSLPVFVIDHIEQKPTEN
jgi:uncharacterized protein (TIGR03435 family)